MDGQTAKLSRLRGLLLGVRLRQIRALSRILGYLGTKRRGARLISRARDSRALGPMLNWLLAYHGRFDSIDAASACAARYVAASHDHPRQISLHADFAGMTRESDYPVLFYLQPVASQLRSVFDLGGSIGNLFFQLDRHLHFSPELLWTVHDLPFKRQAMEDFTRRQNEKRLVFSDDFSSASGVDLFIVVGAIHFFELSLAELLAQLAALPKHVIVNRSPFSKAKDTVAVHDAGTWVNPCKLHNVENLRLAMIELGYDLVAEWPIHERRMHVPLFPECSETYRGFYFRRGQAVGTSGEITAD